MALKNSLVLIIISPLVSSALPSLTSAQQQTLDRLANMPPGQLVDLWDSATRNERAAIQQALFDDIPAAVPVLREQLLAGTEKQKLFACSMVATMRDVNSAGTLIKALDDPNIKVRARAITSLRRIRAVTAAPRIRQELQKTKSKTILKASLAALGKLGSSQDIPVLRGYLAHTDESVRVNAAAAMALLGNYEGQDMLIDATHSASALVRKEATYSLGFVNTARSKGKLQEILRDPSGQWKSYARIALAQQDLTGKTPSTHAAVLQELTRDANLRVAEGALERAADLDGPEGMAVLQEAAQPTSKVRDTASRLLKIKGAQ